MRAMSSSCIKDIAMRLGNRELDLSQPRVMTIINVTDDSFFEHSRTDDAQSIAERVRKAHSEGAEIFDIGGYSSRPGARELTVDEEWSRVRLGLQIVRREVPEAFVSIDTFRAEVVRRAVEEFGPLIVNDISAGELDTEMWNVVAKYRLPYVAMHMRGTPQTMQSQTDYPNGVVSEGCDYFAKRVELLKSRGVENIILDPGFGFAKTEQQNYTILHNMDIFAILNTPVLAGISRKSMLYKPLDATPADVLAATTAAHTIALERGAHILRVHDVRAAAEAISIVKETLKHDGGGIGTTK